MTKRDILALFAPNIGFFIIAVFAFMTAADIGQRHDAQRDQVSRERFDTFIAGVRSGKLQLTTDKMVELIKQSHSISESFWQADVSTGKLMRDFGWIAVGGIILQVSVALRLRKKLRKP